MTLYNITRLKLGIVHKYLSVLQEGIVLENQQRLLHYHKILSDETEHVFPKYD